MKSSIDIAALQHRSSFESLVDLAAEAGVHRIEACVDEGGRVLDGGAHRSVQRLRDCAERAGLTISALIADLDLTIPFVSSPRGDGAGPEDIVSWIVAAQAAGIDQIVLKASASSRLDRAGGDSAGYPSLHQRLLDSLLHLRLAAGLHAVRLAWTVGPDGLLFSPLEARRLVDRISSPWIGLSLDLPWAAQLAPLADWADLLGHRLFSVRFGPTGQPPVTNEQPLSAHAAAALTSSDSIDWPALTASLGRIHFDGCVVCRTTNDLTAAKASLAAAVRRLTQACRV